MPHQRGGISIGTNVVAVAVPHRFDTPASQRGTRSARVLNGEHCGGFGRREQGSHQELVCLQTAHAASHEQRVRCGLIESSSFHDP